MPQYLLSMYQPDGDPPPPEVLGPIMDKRPGLGRRTCGPPAPGSSPAGCTRPARPPWSGTAMAGRS